MTTQDDLPLTSHQQTQLLEHYRKELSRLRVKVTELTAQLDYEKDYSRSLVAAWLRDHIRLYAHEIPNPEVPEGIPQ